MLAANRDQLVAELGVNARELRSKELENAISNYKSLMSATSLAAGFAFAAMVELEHEEILKARPSLRAVVGAFYICCSCTLVLALFVVTSSTFAIQAGQRLALKGVKADSLTRAVAVLNKEFAWIARAGVLAMLCIVGASTCIVYVKLNYDFIGAIELTCTSVFALGTLGIFFKINQLRKALQPEGVVGGSMRVIGDTGEMIDLTSINVVGHSGKSNCCEGATHSHPQRPATVGEI